nr:MAG TPA: hypothetical protein [Caudoviricetes sp.]
MGLLEVADVVKVVLFIVLFEVVFQIAVHPK